MGVSRDSTEISAKETVTVVPQGVTEERDNVLEVALLAGLENFVTKHAVKIVKNTCNKNNGSCVEGCVPGDFGDFCNETCDDRCLSCCESRTDNSKHTLLFEK